MTLSLKSRIQGALTGAVIGAELSFTRQSKPKLFEGIKKPLDMFSVKLDADLDWQPQPNNQWDAKLTPLIGLGARSYIQAKGRATPEVFGSLFKDDEGVATPAFVFDDLHTIQELLKEGMHPRLSGLHHAPCGLVSACMPAVGIYHFADPERAYLDGVELASVAQPRLGADWAGLCAAAVAAAFESGATADSIISRVLAVAQSCNKELFYEINRGARGGCAGSEEDFVNWWSTAHTAGVMPQTNAYRWVAANPIRITMPALARYVKDPVKLMQLLVCVRSDEYLPATGTHAVPAVIAGTIAGALGGPDVFPAEWRVWATPIATSWFGLADVVRDRVNEERTIITEVQSLAGRKTGETSRLHDKIKGAILAGAIGNAMGSPVECRMYWDIDKQYPGGVTTVLDPKRLETEDDNQMAMLLVETYIERDGLPVMARHFGHTWYERLNRDHFHPLCMGNSYDLIRQGVDARIAGHWNTVTGSTVMCMEPVGIFNLADPEWAAQDATAVSYMYQRGLDVTAAAMLAATTANALRGNATVDSVLQAALDVAPRTPMVTFDKRRFRTAYEYISVCLEIACKYDDVLAARKELYDTCLLYSMIDPLELWGLSLAMFKIANGDVRQAAIGGTNIGRDSDTIAGRAAMLSGALKGTAGVPKEWIEMFSPASLGRIDLNAAKLAELVSEKKMVHMKHRQEVA